MWSGTSPGFAGATGAGTVVGVVDSGIDIQNPDFQTTTGTRIKYLWDQAASGSLTVPGGGYGQECTGANIDATNGRSGGPACGPFGYGFDCNSPSSSPPLQTLPEMDCNGHGTHVMGIAASNGRASNLSGRTYSADGASAGTFIGMAPEADIVFVKTDFLFLTDIVDGVNYIFQQAATLGERASVNLSLGTGWGPHDGTSLFETMLDATTGPGQLVSAAAGNFATGGLGISSRWYHSSTSVNASVAVPNDLLLGGTPAAFDIWYPSGQPFSVRVEGPGVDTGFVSQGTSTGTGTNGTCDDSSTSTSSTNVSTGDTALVVNCGPGTAGNGDGEAQLVIWNQNTSGGVCPGGSCNTWRFTVKNDSTSAGIFNAWAVEQADYFIHGGPGNDTSTVASPATAHELISVGSWNNRRQWESQAGTRTDAGPGSVGALSFFSSIGPTRDARQGIDIVAPGEMIGSSLSAYADAGIKSGCFAPSPTAADCTSPDGAHLFLQGTSMAAPHVAGALALLLQLQNLTPTTARQMLSANATADSFTGAVPSVSWGSGKLGLTNSLLNAIPASVPADNSTTSTVLVTVHDATDSALSGKTVTLTQLSGPGGTSIGPASGTSDVAGQLTFAVSSSTAGSMTFYATDTTDNIELGTVAIVFTGQYIPLTPVRVLDTRADGPQTGVCPNTTAECATMAGGGTLDVQITGRETVPAVGVQAVVLNVTATRTTAPGYLSIYPTGQSRPLASSLDWATGQTLANLVQVPVGNNGEITLYNLSGSTDVILDVAGYVSSAAAPPLSAGLFNPLSPKRIVDTRPLPDRVGALGTMGTDSTATVNVTPGGAGLPPNDGTVAAVVLNVTVVNSTQPGYLTLFPDGGTKPLVSNLDWAPGVTTVNRVLVSVGAAGMIDIYNFSGNADVIIDVGGWFSNDTGTGTSGAYNSLTPNRILDTRDLTGQFTIVPSGDGTSVITLTMAGRGGVPSMADPVVPSAVVLNVTVTNTDAPSFLTVFPSDVGTPLSSDLDWSPGVTVANMVVVKVGPDGKIKLFNHTGNVDVIVDMQGWYT